MSWFDKRDAVLNWLRPPSLDRLFKRGYDVTTITGASILLDLVEKESYIESQDYRSEGMRSPLITVWDAKQERETIACGNAPSRLQALWKTFAYQKWFIENFGHFTQGSVLINKFRPGDGMNWHYDVPDATMLQILIYVGDRDFTWDDGGYLKMGVAPVSESGPRDVKEIDRVLPNHGTMVRLLNVGGNFAHAVEPLKTEKNRYTIVLRYGYLENLMTVKKYRRMKDGYG